MSNFEQLEAAAQALPDAYKQNALNLLERMQSVVEGIGDRDRSWRPGNLRVIQPTSKDIPDGAKIGSLVLGDTVYGDKVALIPMRIWDSRQFWDPDPNNAKVLCSSPDAKIGFKGQCYGCPHSVFVEGKGSECNKSKSALVISADLSEMFIINFTKGGYAPGNEWEALMRRAGVAPYKRVYEASVQANPKAKQVKQVVVSPAAQSRIDPALEPFLKAMFDKATAERKQYLESFHENIKKNKESLGHEGQAKLGNDPDVIDVSVEGSSAPAEGQKYRI